MHLLSIKLSDAYYGVPSDYLNLENKNSQYRKGECINVKDFYSTFFLMPKLSEDKLFGDLVDF